MKSIKSNLIINYFFLILLILLKSSVFAQSNSDQSLVQQTEAKINTADLKTFRKLVEQARKAHIDQDYQKAVSGFQAALKVIPNHPQILSELAYSALSLQSYALVDQSSNQAISLLKAHQAQTEKDKDLMGSTLFNLGSSYEKQGQLSKAADAYVESLSFRLNRVVREKLEAIDPKKFIALNTFHAKALKGPFMKSSDLCQVAIKDIQVEGEKNPCELVILDQKTDSSINAGLSDFLNVEKNMAHFKNDPSFSLGLIAIEHLQENATMPISMDFLIFIKTEKGYFYQNQPVSIYNPGAFGIMQNLNIQQIKRFKFFGYEYPVFKIQFETDFRDADMAGAIEKLQKSQFLVWCGIGNSMQPSCTQRLEIQSSFEVIINSDMDSTIDQSQQKPLESWTLSIEEDEQSVDVKQGVLTRIKKLPKSASFELGKRKLIFE